MRTLQNNLRTRAAAILLFILGIIASGRTFAQTRGVDVNVDLDRDNDVWYANTTLWIVVGVGLFIIALVAIVSAGKKT